jgi:hypothetical protein
MEEQHQAIVKRALDLREGRVVERLGEVDALDVGAQRAGHRPNLDASIGVYHRLTVGDCRTARKSPGAEKFAVAIPASLNQTNNLDQIDNLGSIN